MNLNTDISNHIPPGVVLPNQQDLQGLSLQIPNAIPPHVVNFNVDGNDFDNEEEPVPTTPFQKAEISKLKETFVTRGWIIIIFVICVNADFFTESTGEIQGSWGATKNRGKVVKALTSAVKKAERENKIAFPETFKLFKFLFPHILK